MVYRDYDELEVDQEDLYDPYEYGLNDTFGERIEGSTIDEESLAEDEAITQGADGDSEGSSSEQKEEN